MFVEQTRWSSATGWVVSRAPRQDPSAHVVLFFGAREAIESSRAVEVLRAAHPQACIVGCSTAGEISETTVSDGSVVATAIHFEHTVVRAACQPLESAEDSRSAGERIARELSSNDLVHVFVLAEGLKINGSDLVAGLRHGLPANVAVTGGLAADGALFEKTCVYCDGEREGGAVVAVGFYGDRLRIGYGSMGGWDTFGPERLVTRAEGNVLYELDGSSALELYKQYLGSHAADLPASGLRFPLSLRGESGDRGIVRTILGIDEAAGSLVFAGDIPQGVYARLMKANVDRLIDGASEAATSCRVPLASSVPSLGILISCVGRKLVLKQRAEEEVESVRAVLGDEAVLSGFYSYGEIAPFASSTKCELHNQTMTITTFTED
ncbi:MAG: FIST C-terminal domain-containing protein [Gemmatimonadaceae bacterium]|nr:FIST C-terminal domain-containing protein [Gemmatimonadaceae bacterium]